MKTSAAAILTLVAALAGQGAASEVIRSYESREAFLPVQTIDALVLAEFLSRGLQPAHLCSDEVFVRRVYLDVIGTLPRPQEVLRFLRDERPHKRAILIDSLLEREEFADYWTLKWCDLLRVKAEFPINLWPNAVQAYHRWIYEAIRDNKSYDEFVRELLTSSGSNFRVPPVNFYRAIQDTEPSAIAAAVALTFMGARIENWPEERRAGMAAFFERVAYKSTSEWKEEIVYPDPAADGVLKAVFPDGAFVEVSPYEDPREAFADWLIREDNPWFARNIVNRAWAWLLGRGLIHEPDDIRDDNPAVHPDVLAYLEHEFYKSNCDLKHIFRLILNSCTYQQSSIARSDEPEATIFFAHYPVRRLDAEVLSDALSRISGIGEGYSSPIPEPFSFIPKSLPSITLADGSITSQFLEMFGRPSRDTGLESERNNEPTDAQCLHLLNSTHIQNKIERSRNLRRLANTVEQDPSRAINMLYLSVLSRFPTQAELDTADSYLQTDGLTLTEAVGDLLWALINTKEFLYRH